MQNIDETQALAQVFERLAELFPDVPVTAVRLAVEREHRKLDGRPVRNYVPVLVERAARDALASQGGARAKVMAST